LVGRVRGFKLPLDLSSIDRLDREHYRLVIYSLAAVILALALAGVFAFGLSLKGNEETMVPDIRGQELAQALVKLQEKELYPRLSLRFTEDSNDRGRVLEQRPLPGAIVKAGRRINLVVSRGPVVDRIGNYVGEELMEVRAHLQTLFSSSRPLITIADPPIYVFNEAKPGAILEQKPLPDTEISGPITIQFVVSRGPEKAKVSVPDLRGLDWKSGLSALEQASLSLTVTLRKAQDGEKPGTFVSETPEPGSAVATSSSVALVATLPAPESDMIAGVFAQDLPINPYPLRLLLEVLKPTGERLSLFRTNFAGGKIAVPYFVSDGSILILSVLDRELARTEVRKIK
ncbi:MAG: PASTA domain-containing protein, partial [Rectinemataceae bacterium]